MTRHHARRHIRQSTLGLFRRLIGSMMSRMNRSGSGRLIRGDLCRLSGRLNRGLFCRLFPRLSCHFAGHLFRRCSSPPFGAAGQHRPLRAAAAE